MLSHSLLKRHCIIWPATIITAWLAIFTTMSVSINTLASSTMYHGQNTHFQVISSQGGQTVQVWVQVMDSCKQAIPGAVFILSGGGLNVVEGPARGTRPTTVSNTPPGCPLQRGNCAKVSIGCLTWNIPVPNQGTGTYQIKEVQAPAHYIPCTGGSVCPGGPVVITLTITSNGSTSATAFNVYPDRKTVTWPSSGAPYQATVTDPVVVHNFQLGNGSCDGDNDADDHLTGSPSGHCDNDGDSHH